MSDVKLHAEGLLGSALRRKGESGKRGLGRGESWLQRWLQRDFSLQEQLIGADMRGPRPMRHVIQAGPIIDSLRNKGWRPEKQVRLALGVKPRTVNCVQPSIQELGKIRYFVMMRQKTKAGAKRK